MDMDDSNGLYKLSEFSYDGPILKMSLFIPKKHVDECF
jgi:hypothetical protein